MKHLIISVNVKETLSLPLHDIAISVGVTAESIAEGIYKFQEMDAKELKVMTKRAKTAVDGTTLCKCPTWSVFSAQASVMNRKIEVSVILAIRIALC